MPDIPGMPTSPPLPTFTANTTIMNEPTDVGTPKDFTTVQSGVSPLVQFNVPQSHVVTTPIALPGMPPITVSASLPQTTSFYTSVLQQNEVTDFIVAIGNTRLVCFLIYIFNQWFKLIFYLFHRYMYF